MATTLSAERAERAPAELSARRRFLSTTPGQLRAESLAVLLSALLAGLLASLVVADQLGSVNEIADEAEPAIRNARQVQTSLAEANAAAATAFLAGGVEDAEQRRNYELSMVSATDALEEATRLLDEPAPVGDEREAVTLSSEIATYSGLIETARTNNRQGFPVGAAYLDTASALLEESISPRTDEMANRAAEQYRDAYDRQRGLALVLGIISIGLVLIVVLMLVYVQFQLHRRFNRTFNIPIVASTVVAVGLALWLTTAMSSQFGHLTAARTDGYDGTRLYLDLRGTGFGAKADEARFLIARGAGQGFEDDFQQRAAVIAELDVDLQAHASESADADAGTRAGEAVAAWQAYRDVHDQIVAADSSGDRETAVELARGQAGASFDRFDTATAEALEANRLLFASEMAEAEQAMRWLRIGSLIAAALVAGLAVYGLQLRINEYR